MALIRFLKEAVTVALQIRLLKKKRSVLAGKPVSKKSAKRLFQKPDPPLSEHLVFRLTSF